MSDDARTPLLEEVGVLLPGVDPTIGEIVVGALMANPNAPVGAVLVRLVLDAPDPIKVEVAEAFMELMLCKQRGQLYWVGLESNRILVGARNATLKDNIEIGPARWPMGALLDGPPKSAVIRMPDGARRVWMACSGLDGAVVRQSEAIAIGNAMVESFGGRLIEDRHGPDIMRQSFIENNMTERAKRRAAAVDAVDRMTVMQQAAKVKGAQFARVALAEALPGSLQIGARIKPEGCDGPVYTVERRINEDWVLIVATVPGPAGNAGAANWVGAEGQHGPFGPNGPAHWGFTDSDAVAEESFDEAGNVQQAESPADSDTAGAEPAAEAGAEHHDRD